MTAGAHDRILIAGVGNLLHGDDGFGIEVAKRLMQLSDLPAGVMVVETGIGGMSLVQELMSGYAALILIDTVQRGSPPGTLHRLKPVLPDLSGLSVHELRDYFADTHYATPMRVLSLLERLDRLPPVLRIIGCEPARCEDLHIGLNAEVAAAVDEAVEMVKVWAHELATAAIVPGHGSR